MRPHDCALKAHTIKTASEMMGMAAISVAAYELEKAALNEVDELGAAAACF